MNSKYYRLCFKGDLILDPLCGVLFIACKGESSEEKSSVGVKYSEWE